MPENQPEVEVIEPETGAAENPLDSQIAELNAKVATLMSSLNDLANVTAGRIQKIEADLAAKNDAGLFEAQLREVNANVEKNRDWIEGVMAKYFAGDRPDAGS